QLTAPSGPGNATAPPRSTISRQNVACSSVVCSALTRSAAAYATRASGGGRAGTRRTCSPGAAATASSSTPKTGSPLDRFSTNAYAGGVGCTSSGTVRPAIATSRSVGGGAATPWSGITSCSAVG